MIIKGISIGTGRPVICVPLTGTNEKEILLQAQNAVEQGARMLEWRADRFEAWQDVLAVRRVAARLAVLCHSTVFLVTLRTKNEGGSAAIAGEEYESWLRRVSRRPLADLLDVETDTCTNPRETVRTVQQAGIYAVASHHDFAKTPPTEEMEACLRGMVSLGADIAKLAVMPRDLTDVLRLAEAACRVKDAGTPLIALSMGALGAPTRVFGEWFGSSVTFASVGEGSAPGQMPFASVDAALDAIHAIGAGHPLFLIGFMGAGKTTVARALRRLTHWPMTDLDREIEERCGMRIAEIFAEYGEEEFRRMESRLLDEVSSRGGAIVSCGGGVIKSPANIARMRERGTVIWLTASPQTILSRVRFDDSRPLLNGKKTIEDIEEMLRERRPLYETASDFSVSTDGRRAAEIASEILSRAGLLEEFPRLG